MPKRRASHSPTPDPRKSLWRNSHPRRYAFTAEDVQQEGLAQPTLLEELHRAASTLNSVEAPDETAVVSDAALSPLATTSTTADSSGSTTPRPRTTPAPPPTTTDRGQQTESGLVQPPNYAGVIATDALDVADEMIAAWLPFVEQLAGSGEAVEQFWVVERSLRRFARVLREVEGGEGVGGGI